MSSELDPLILKLDGGIAQEHKIDVFQFSETLSGFGSVVLNSLHMLERLEVTERRKKSEFQILVTPPVSGSVEIAYLIETAFALSPIFFEPFVGQGIELLWRTVGSAFLTNSGRTEDAEVLVKPILKYLESRDQLEDRQRSEERAKDERTLNRAFDLLDHNARRCRSSCKKAVSSVGKNSENLQFSFKKDYITIDEKDAAFIRIKAEESYGPKTNYICRMDGIIEHSKTIKVKVEGLDTAENFVTAVVEDKAFGTQDNSYITALNTKQKLKILACPVLKDDKVIRLEIYSAQLL